MNLANTYFTIIYFIRGVARSQGASYARALQMSVSAIVLFSAAWVWKSYFCGLDSCHREFDMNIYSWNAVLYNNRPTACREKQQQSRSEQRKGRLLLSENVQIKIIVDVSLLFGTFQHSLFYLKCIPCILTKYINVSGLSPGYPLTLEPLLDASIMKPFEINRDVYKYGQYMI